MAELDLMERFEGKWNGEDVHPKRVWSGHRFSDDEVEKLLAGEEITIEAVSRAGKAFKCKGKLAKLTYNGQEYVGFERGEFVNDDGPGTWCRYTFTDAEKADLMAGKEVTGTKFIGKSGRAFKAKVRWDDKEKKISIVEFIK